MPIPAIGLWLYATPVLGMVVAFLISFFLLLWAIKAGEFRHLCFLLLLLAFAAWTAFNPERSQRIFLHHPVIVLIAAGIVIALLRGHGLHGWPAAFLAVSIFVLPSGGFKTQLGPNILDAWLLGAAFVLLGLILSRRFRQIHLTGRAWIALCVLLIAGKFLRGQRPHKRREPRHDRLDPDGGRRSGNPAVADLLVDVGRPRVLVVGPPPHHVRRRRTAVLSTKGDEHLNDKGRPRPPLSYEQAQSARQSATPQNRSVPRTVARGP